MKNIVTEIWNQLDIMTMRMKESEKQKNNTEDKIMENNEAEKKRDRNIFILQTQLDKYQIFLNTQ